MTSTQSQVFVVDDDAAVRATLVGMLQSAGLRVFDFATGGELLEALQGAQPDCIVTDLRMPGLSGLELQRRIAQRGIRVPVIVISGQADVAAAVDALKGGAVEFLEKPCSGHVLIEAVERAIALHEAEQRRRANAERFAPALHSLSPREREVLALVLEGHTSRAIASHLAIVEGTVENHRTRIMRKLDVTCVAALVRRVFETDPALLGIS
jgi:two-component system response regulator FixJ